MDHDIPSISYLVGIAITAAATIAVALISTRSGKNAAARDAPFTPQESGEHAHTRDVIKIEAERILDRIEMSDFARGVARQSQQIGVSADRLGKRADEEEG